MAIAAIFNILMVIISEGAATTRTDLRLWDVVKGVRDTESLTNLEQVGVIAQQKGRVDQRPSRESGELPRHIVTN
jgi:hypothetical protein